MAKHHGSKGFPRIVKALKAREEAAHGDFVAVLKDVQGASAQALEFLRQANNAAIIALVKREAAREGRDLSKWIFNADTMRWQERGPASPAKPGA